MHKTYRDKGLEIVGFPCNQFKNQEPGSAQEIMEFTQKYGVEFPLTAKCDVNGENTHPVY